MINEVTYAEEEYKKNLIKMQKYWRNLVTNEWGIKFPNDYQFKLDTFWKKYDSIDLWRKGFFGWKHIGGMYPHKKLKKKEAFLHVVILQEKEYGKIKDISDNSKINIEVTVSQSK